MGATMRLVHYTRRPIHELERRDYTLRKASKPAGLWLSVDGNGDGWHDWCLAENFSPTRTAYAHDVELDATSNVLWLKNVHAVEEFQKEYGIFYEFFGEIDWRRVQAAGYTGIIITPYFWEIRRELGRFFWYYSWDCASGCIWNLDAIASFGPPRRSLIWEDICVPTNPERTNAKP